MNLSNMKCIWTTLVMLRTRWKQSRMKINCVCCYMGEALCTQNSLLNNKRNVFVYKKRNIRNFPNRGTGSNLIHSGISPASQLYSCTCKYLSSWTVSVKKSALLYEELEGSQTGICVLTLNRQEVRNAINFQLLKEFESTLCRFRNHGAPRIIILRSGHKGIFCAGADLKERLQLSDSEYWRWSVTIRHMTLQFSELSSVTIAAIDGAALGGGLELALMCDIRIAASNAKMGLPETSLGIIPGAGGTQRLPRLVGPARSKELIFTGRILTSFEAYTFGLLNHLVIQNSDGDAAYRKALKLAEQILHKELNAKSEKGSVFQIV